MVIFVQAETMEERTYPRDVTHSSSKYGQLVNFIDAFITKQLMDLLGIQRSVQRASSSPNLLTTTVKVEWEMPNPVGPPGPKGNEERHKR